MTDLPARSERARRIITNSQWLTYLEHKRQLKNVGAGGKCGQASYRLVSWRIRGTSLTRGRVKTENAGRCGINSLDSYSHEAASPGVRVCGWLVQSSTVEAENLENGTLLTRDGSHCT
ncbi:hypothetical protein EVAR_45872_1 [Eumeta japonica]|uniref:Uncharacterized protein n=1 Tax=Eumeta variegata TaxID=151549 RepID=A0A4C1WNF0_EUMVA|nr:hypothetical protein EVAR_45872_1 [Eumeta japonica]